MVELTALLGPVMMAESMAVLVKFGEHDNNDAALLPHQLPEVCRGGGQGALGGDVGRVAGVVVRLGELY